MPRYLLIAGVDFGTSFTKVVVRDNNTPGQPAVVVTFPGHADGLLPSLIGVTADCLLPPNSLQLGSPVAYLKMLAAHVASGKPMDATSVRIPTSLGQHRRPRQDLDLVRELLAFYLAHVIAATEQFIRTSSPWRDFDFTTGGNVDHLVYQLAVPTGMLIDVGATERLFRQALIAAFELRSVVQADMRTAKPCSLWSDQVNTVFAAAPADLESRFAWQCLIYPEVAAAVQTVFRTPNARDGLYITMDVGAGTVDLNAFKRSTHQGLQRVASSLDYYSAIVCELGTSCIRDPYRAVPSRNRREVMAELHKHLQSLYVRAKRFQPNHGVPGTGTRTWDRSIQFIFGGGAYHDDYRIAFSQGLEHSGIHLPMVHDLPAARDLIRPRNVGFGRFAVAYGLSFFRPNLDKVRLPQELTPFQQLYPTPQNDRPSHYGFNWDD